jgi:ActR/RegA family two-component response regulator
MKRVLFIDDSAETLKYFSRAVSRIFKVKVDLAHSFIQAVEAMKTRSYDYIFVDINLSPGLGPDAVIECQKVHGVDYSKTKIVLMSGLDLQRMCYYKSKMNKEGLDVIKCEQKPIRLEMLRGVCHE